MKEGGVYRLRGHTGSLYRASHWSQVPVCCTGASQQSQVPVCCTGASHQSQVPVYCTGAHTPWAPCRIFSQSSRGTRKFLKLSCLPDFLRPPECGPFCLPIVETIIPEELLSFWDVLCGKEGHPGWFPRFHRQQVEVLQVGPPGMIH